MNITLIGMPGAGKSFIGKRLARSLKLQFLDIDQEIERILGTRLPQILANVGEEGFKKKEEEILMSLVGARNSILISPGGSIVYSERAMDFLSRISHIIYLEAPLPLIKRRISKTPRAIVGLNKKTLRDIYDERVPLYQKWAEVTFSADEKPEVLVQNIITSLKIPALS